MTIGADQIGILADQLQRPFLRTRHASGEYIQLHAFFEQQRRDVANVGDDMTFGIEPSAPRSACGQ